MNTLDITRGEWWFNPDGDEHCADPTIEGPNGPIASIHHLTRVVGEGKEAHVEYGHFEDGYLIAAAPDLLDIAHKAATVRRLQRAYFADRTKENLIASKQAESALDKALATVLTALGGDA